MGRVDFYSWSHTRSRTLSECPRKAFFEYYSKSEPGHYSIRKLKELTTLAMWTGSVVDATIGEALGSLRQKGELTFDLAERGTETYLQGLERSKEIVEILRIRARSWDEKNAEAFRPLQHDYYGIDVGRQFINHMRKRVVECLDNFEQSEVLERIKSIKPDQWGAIPNVDSSTVPTFTLAKRFKVYAAYDFWFQDGDDYHFLDWKTGVEVDKSKRAAQKQLGTYALFGATKYKVPFDRIHTQAVWLQGAAEWKPEQQSKDALAKVRDEILADVEREHALLEIQKYPSRTVYLAKREDFPPRPELKRCLDCKFRELCAEGGEICGHVCPTFSS